MQKRLDAVRALSVAVLSLLLVTSGLVALAPPALAAAYDPSAPPYAFDPGDVDTLSVYDATTGEPVTGGSATAPLRNYYFVSSRDWNPDHTKASLFGYLAEEGKAQGAWSGKGLGSSTTYPATTAPSPVSEAGTRPVARGDSALTFANLATSFPSSAPATSAYYQLYQVRVKTTFPTPTSITWASADVAIDVSAGTWRLLRPTAVTGATTSTVLSVSPTSPSVTGTTQTLSAQVTPANAVGTVQFQDGHTNLGSAVAVSGGTASTTAVLPVGDHSVTATFTASDAGAFAPSTSNSVPYTVTSTATVPAKPTLVSATSADSAAVVTWGTASTGGSAITSYTLTASSASAPTVAVVLPVAQVTAGSEAGTLTARLTGLTNGTAYNVSIAATNDIGTSPLSDSLPVTPQPATAPSAPREVAALGKDSSVQVDWTAPASDGGSPVTGYTVTATPADGTAVSGTTDGVTTTLLLTGLVNDNEYVVTVRAANIVGPGQASTAVNVTPHLVTVPGVPLKVTVAPFDRSLAVSWQPPAKDGGAPITGYRVTVIAPDLTSVTKSSVGTRTVVTPLTNGVTYHVTVVATNEVGDSAATEVVSATPLAVPSAPLGLSAVPAPGTATVSWFQPDADGGSPITAYTVSAMPLASAAAVTVDVPTTTTTLTGLAAGVRYSIAVVAHNANGAGPASSSVVVMIPARPKPTQVSLNVPVIVSAGRPFVLTGAVTGISGAVRVVLRTNAAGRPSVEQAYNLTDGRLRLVLTANQHTSFRLLFPGTPAYAASYAVGKTLVRAVLTVSSVSISGRTVTVMGRALPGIAGRRVRLAEISTGLRVLVYGTTDSTGRFVLRAAFPRGSSTLQVLAAHSATDYAPAAYVKALRLL